MRALPMLALLLLPLPLRGQELLWELHSQSGLQYGGCTPSFGDYDHDGCEDLLVGARNHLLPTQPTLLQVLSGRNGSVLGELFPLPYNAGNLRSAGDFDGDGYPDVAFFSGSSQTIGYFEVWSIAANRPLLVIPNIVSGSYGGAHACPDVTGDGLPDVVYVQGNAEICVHEHGGKLLYKIPADPLGFLPTDIADIGDLDNDGCDDFLVGAIEWFTGQVFGAVILVSGRTGTALRIHWGEQPGDGINSDVRAAGDVDGDGVMDYAAGNQGAWNRALIIIWSGATGAVIRQWAVPVAQLAGKLLAGQDVDLDGRPDVISVSPAFLNDPGPPQIRGRLRTLSSRDGQDLVHLAADQYYPSWGQTYADLGVQPGNPYPVFAITDVPVVPPFSLWPRIRVYRCSPTGTSFVGNGCSTTTIPTIGIRRVDGITNDTSRLVLGSAPPNALAICVVAAATAGSSPVPLDALGMPGCDLLVPPILLEAQITGAAGMDRGYAAFDFPSTMVATNGTQFAAQWIVLDPNSLEHATTQRLEFRVQ